MHTHTRAHTFREKERESDTSRSDGDILRNLSKTGIVIVLTSEPTNTNLLCVVFCAPKLSGTNCTNLYIMVLSLTLQAICYIMVFMYLNVSKHRKV